MGNLIVSHISAIEPHVIAAVYALEIQVGSRRIRIHVIIKPVYIGAAGIILGHKRRVKRKRIPDVCILMGIIALHLPYTRHRDLIKTAYVIPCFVKRFLYIVNTFKIFKFPVSVQKLQPVRSFPVLCQIIHSFRGRNIIGSGR